MAADSFHHSVELSLKKQGKTYDFQDFVDAVKNSRKEVHVKVMEHTDFYQWQDLTSQTKLTKSNPVRVYMADIVQVVASRGKNTLAYKSSFQEDTFKELDFLMQKAIKKGIPIPDPFVKPIGFPKEKRDKLLKELGSIIPGNRQVFWKNIPIQEEK